MSEDKTKNDSLEEAALQAYVQTEDLDAALVISRKESETKEENNNLEDNHEDNFQNDIKQIKPKLDKRVLFQVCTGIFVVFGLMLFINRFIFQIATELKTAYYLSIVALNILFVILILSVKTSNKITWLELGWKKTEVKRGVINVLKIWGLIWLIDFIYMLIIVSMGIIPEGNELVYLLEKPTVPTLIINIILIAVVAPFIEETLFRGLLFGSLRTYFGCWTAITISAAFFSALHFQLIGFVPRFLLGLGLGYLYVKHDSIYPAVGLHALNNFLAVLMVSLLS